MERPNDQGEIFSRNREQKRNPNTNVVQKDTPGNQPLTEVGDIWFPGVQLSKRKAFAYS